MSESISAQARLIAALGETMRDNLWTSDILTRCDQIEQAVKEIRRTVASRQGGER